MALPETMRDETGVIFASAFSGVDVAIEEAHKAATDEAYSLDGRYLLRVISMGQAALRGVHWRSRPQHTHQ